MIPVPYNEAVPQELSSKEYITIVLEDNTEYTGEFTDLRVDRKTIPEGLYAYDLRDADCSGDICQVQYIVWVNHFGTIITDKPITNIDDAPSVKDWWFTR